MASRDAEVWAAVRDYLEGYSELPSDVVRPGESFDDVDPLTPYLIVEDLRFDPVRVYWRGPNWRTGSLMLMCMLPLHFTYDQRIEYAGLIADYFSEDASMQYGDVALRVAQQPTISDAGYRDGSHFRMPLDIRWEGFVA